MERALDSMVEKYGMLQEEPTQEGGEEPVNWFRNRVEEIVEAKLDTYTADITGLPDYALATAGASVVGHSALLRGFHLCTWSSFALWPCFIEFCMECSKTMGFGAQMIHPLADELVLRPGTLPGRCLPLAGSSGSIDVRLRAPVAITAITLEHIDKRIAYRGQWSPAVKEFEVWGFNATRKGKGMEGFEELGRYAFEEDGRHVQTFDMVDGKLPVSHIRLKIISNHGSGDYTCLYRVRVHGNEM
ncbi:hypothetical protein BSKO_09190 [Bryopsis sp. KO-2023]|nr:hypothetical protein BSKO_09190 [Bryopsis sp. KO-2023]